MISETLAAAARDFRSGRIWLKSGRAIRKEYFERLLENTGHWFMELECFRNWISAEGPSLIFLHGTLGTGKSTLCAAITHYLQNHERPWDATISCFLDDVLSQSDSAKYILKTIAYQLSEHNLPIVSKFQLRSVLNNIENLNGKITSVEFRQNLRDIIGVVDSQARLMLVLDGFDRDDSVKDIIMEEVIQANLSRKRSELLRCVISTQAPFDAVLHQACVSEINLNNERGAQRDLKEFAMSRLITLTQTSTPDELSLETLADRLCSRAKGSFLWVSLATENIRRMESQAELANQIDLLPPTVSNIYQMRLRGIPTSSVETARCVFSWLTAATRHLSLSELLDALAIRAEAAHASVCLKTTVTAAREQDSDTDIARICGWLVIITEEGVVRFTHQSVRRHFLATNEQFSASEILLKAHELLAQTCLVLLNSREKKNTSLFCIDSPSAQPSPSDSPTLIDYAVANWTFHYRIAEAHSKVLAGTLQHCISITLDYACDFFSISQNRRSVQIASTTLRICAHYGFISLTQICLEMGVPSSVGSCHYCETPIAIATAGGHTPVAALLLHKAAFTTSHVHDTNEGLLQLAAAHGSLETIEFLLTQGANVDAIDQGSGRTSLHNAAAFGHLSLVKLLMDYEVIVNAVIPVTRETPLHLAALHGHLPVVKYLVDGRDASTKEIELYDRIVEQPYFRDWTDDLLEPEGEVGHFASEETRHAAEEHLGELLSCSNRYTDINMRTREGWTAVHLAASKGHDAIVGFLLERGATLQVTGNTRCTALQIAAEYGHLATVKLLLAAGADLNGGPEHIGSILGRIEENGHHAITNLLLWHAFVSQVTGSARRWPVLCLATKSKHATVHDAIHKKRCQKKASTRASRSRNPRKDIDMQT